MDVIGETTGENGASLRVYIQLSYSYMIRCCMHDSVDVDVIDTCAVHCEWLEGR